MSEAHYSDYTGPDFTVTREFDAPIALVFDAWTNPERLALWWGASGLSIATSDMDFRPGGHYHYSMVGTSGVAIWGKWAYIEIDLPNKIVFVNSFSDADLGLVRHPAAPTWPLEVYNVQTFAPAGNKTRMTIITHPIRSSREENDTFAALDPGMDEYFEETFKQLDDYLKQVSG